MSVQVTQYKRCAVVKMPGRVDTDTAPELEKTFAEILSEGTSNIVFDMSDVTFLSSRGIWVILEALKACRKENGNLVLANVSDNIKESLELAGVEHFVRIYDDLVSAVGSF